MNWIGLDIGGANIKISSAKSNRSLAFELWRRPKDLSRILEEAVPDLPDRRCAVTMTGELADGYQNKQTGVAEIVASVERVFPNSVYYQTTGMFVDAEVAVETWLNTAAANWHAIAVWLAGTFFVDSGVVIDIGSTTTDVIPVQNGVPINDALTDLQRLMKGRLVYTGVSRSSICGLVESTRLPPGFPALANEFFATIEDAFLVLGRIPESSDCNTADGRPKSVACSKQRLARMFCSDVSEIGEEALRDFAFHCCENQEKMIFQAIETSLVYMAAPSPVVIAGEGEWLAAEVIEKGQFGFGKVIRVSKSLEKSVADCAGAVAVRELARMGMANVAHR